MNHCRIRNASTWWHKTEMHSWQNTHINCINELIQCDLSRVRSEKAKEESLAPSATMKDTDSCYVTVRCRSYFIISKILKAPQFQTILSNSSFTWSGRENRGCAVSSSSEELTSSQPATSAARPLRMWPTAVLWVGFTTTFKIRQEEGSNTHQVPLIIKSQDRKDGL